VGEKIPIIWHPESHGIKLIWRPESHGTKKIEIPRGKRARNAREKRGGSMKKARSVEETSEMDQRKNHEGPMKSARALNVQSEVRLRRFWGHPDPPRDPCTRSSILGGGRADETAVIACQLPPVVRATKNLCGPYNLVEHQEHISLGHGILRLTQKSTDTILCDVNVGHFQNYNASRRVPLRAGSPF